MKRRTNETTGPEALKRRDALEVYLTMRFPGFAHSAVSAIVTPITGLAPTWRERQPVFANGKLRHVYALLGGLSTGTALVLAGPGLGLKVIGSVLLAGALRNLSAGTGHELTHSTAGLPWGPKVVDGKRKPDTLTPAVYDAVTAVALLPSWKTYQVVHGWHHAFAGVQGEGVDPDEQMVESLGARFTGWGAFLRTLADPVLHWNFLTMRLRASLGAGAKGSRKKGGPNEIPSNPVWRRVLAGLVSVAITFALPWQAALAWWLAVVLLYQVFSLCSLAVLHLWGYRAPEGAKPGVVATTITFGRLLIPDANWTAWFKLPLYALVRATFLNSALQSHDQHHRGKLDWWDAPYVRTALLLEGAEVWQTTSLRAAFETAFEAARRLPGRSDGWASDDEMLGV